MINLKAASVRIDSSEINPKTLEARLDTVKDCDVAVFPQHAGLCFRPEMAAVGSSAEYLDCMKALSEKYPDILICTGGMREIDNGDTYQFSVLLSGGRELLRQRQLYLSRRERETGLKRGISLECIDYRGFKIAAILGTDIFYPQVSRQAAMKGVNLALCPVAYEKCGGWPLQVSGVWREVESNQFFAVECPFRGSLDGTVYDGIPIIHAPLEMTENSEGFLDKGDGLNDFAGAFLDNDTRLRAISSFNVLSQLNPHLYKNMNMFGGDR